MNKLSTKSITLLTIIIILSLFLSALICCGISCEIKRKNVQAASVDVYTYTDLKNVFDNYSSYKSHTINIKADIDCENQILKQWGEEFTGSINGENHTIKNFRIEIRWIKVRDDRSKPPIMTRYGGMFWKFNGEMKNLHLENMSFYCTETASRYDNSYLYAMAYYNSTGTIKNCYFENIPSHTMFNSYSSVSVSNSILLANGGGTYTNCFFNTQTDHSNTGSGCYSRKDSSFPNLTSTYWFIPKSNEYNEGYPMLKQFIEDWDTYTVKTVENSDQHAIDKGTVNISSFSVPIPKDDPSTKYTGIPDNNSPNQAFVVEVIGQNVIATPACETCRQFSHWEVNGKTITAHFKEKEVPANCTVKFNGHSFANTTSSISLFEFKLHPGSTIKCEVSDDKQIYTYIVVKGGDCPDCGRPLTTGEEYARITYTLKIDPGQPASKYEIDSLDSGGFIKGLNTEYTITKSTTISPTFILKEYDVEIG